MLCFTMYLINLADTSRVVDTVFESNNDSYVNCNSLIGTDMTYIILASMCR